MAGRSSPPETDGAPPEQRPSTVEQVVDAPVGPVLSGPAPAFPIVPNRTLITICAMLATLMQALDSTIANVALPYMQGSLAATSDQVTWVLTSYIVAAAIMTAPVGWLSLRFGRKPLFLISLVGFTGTSMLCGLAQSIDQMVAFRLLQGLFGAALVPLSQSTMLDIYPPEQRGSAMAIWGMGVMVGPILGPTLGGYLTEIYNWRYVFYVNLPFGILATAGILVFLPATTPGAKLRFDWLGFGVLALGIGALQIMLDRGQDQDWFSSREILVETVLAGLGIYLFTVHLFTAPRPFVSPRLFFDRNFSSCMLMMFAVGLVLVASSALMAPYLQTLAQYPVQTAGLVLAPRGFGTMASMLVAGRLSSRVDPRKIMLAGILVLVGSMWSMVYWTPDVSIPQQVLTIILQGAGLGLVFTPLQVVAFATLDPVLRTDGTSLLSLFRNIGSAIGVSVFQAMLVINTQVSHADLARFATPFNPALRGLGAVHQAWNPATLQGATALNQVITTQAQIIAYSDDFKLMALSAVPTVLLLLIMRRPGRASSPPEHGAVME